jgi:hypothetical protein
MPGMVDSGVGVARKPGSERGRGGRVGGNGDGDIEGVAELAVVKS